MVAAHAACRFFDRPSPSTFDELVKAAKKAEVEEPVRAAALRFLETGVDAVSGRLPASRGRHDHAHRVFDQEASRFDLGRQRHPRNRRRPAPDQLKIDPAWPLPMPDYLIPLLNRPGRYDSAPRPHLEVLLEMAMAAKRPDEVLRWFDKMRSEPQRPGYFQQVRPVTPIASQPRCRPRTRNARSRSTWPP